ncbi:MAG TPA: 2-dehydropantoate 2-reductase [Candidatus Binatia bacterium]|nr:2-dehydropantoate 2-reductase [Candidatus Binatia bacterium]
MTASQARTRIAVMGAGAVGGYLGARLASVADVHLIARGEHLRAIRERGLTIVTPHGERSIVRLEATDDASTIGPVDVVLFLVKSYDTDAAAHAIAPLLHDDTAVISLQNGVDNEDRIAAVIGDRHVLGGAAYILAAIQEPGVVRSNKARLVLGERQPGPPSERLRSFAGLANAAGGIDARLVDDIRTAKWEKYVLLVAFSAMTAATQLTVGDLRRSPAAVAMLRSIMEEAWSVGRALGVDLPGDLVDRQHALILAQDDDEGSSLRHDLLIGHRMELEALQGTLRRLGRRTGIPTPWTDAAYAILEPWAIRNERAANDGGADAVR